MAPVLYQREPGHAITAGGTREAAWHDQHVGSGSIFFEKILAGLDGRADSLPSENGGEPGDGIISAHELFAYLAQEVQLSTDHRQNPQIGDISRHGSLGSFFFLNRRRQIENGNLSKWNPGDLLTMGETAKTAEQHRENKPGQDRERKATKFVSNCLPLDRFLQKEELANLASGVTLCFFVSDSDERCLDKKTFPIAKAPSCTASTAKMCAHLRDRPFARARYFVTVGERPTSEYAILDCLRKALIIDLD